MKALESRQIFRMLHAQAHTLKTSTWNFNAIKLFWPLLQTLSFSLSLTSRSDARTAFPRTKPQIHPESEEILFCHFRDGRNSKPPQKSHHRGFSLFATIPHICRKTVVCERRMALPSVRLKFRPYLAKWKAAAGNELEASSRMWNHFDDDDCGLMWNGSTNHRISCWKLWIIYVRCHQCE